MYELRNIKCVIELDEISPKLLSKFEQRKQNNILRLKQTIVLTIYPSSYNRNRYQKYKRFSINQVIFCKKWNKKKRSTSKQHLLDKALFDRKIFGFCTILQKKQTSV